MENHPIPQDVTGFKFKLIGSVTVKQFLYLIGGGILAAVFFMVPLPGIIKYPISFLCGGIGAALAFVPIDGRPMDVMIKNFLKALPAENQYIYRKKGAEALIAEFFTHRQVAVPKQQEAKAPGETALDAKRALLYKTLRHASKPDENEAAILSNITNYLNESSHSASPPVQNIDAAPHDPAVQIVTPSQIVSPPADVVKVVSPMQPAEKPAEQPTSTPQEPETTVEKATPPAEVAAPQKTSPQPEPPSPHVTVAPPEPIPTTPQPMTTTQTSQTLPQGVTPNSSSSVTTVAPEKSLKAGFPSLPDTPNIVMGIIKDPRGKVLPNILVEILDTQGIPVRAFKTNALGQFAAATPLPDGEYNVVLEDPRKQNEFEKIHISLSGEIFEPLEIISVDQREKLRRELFGNQARQIAA